MVIESDTDTINFKDSRPSIHMYDATKIKIVGNMPISAIPPKNARIQPRKTSARLTVTLYTSSDVSTLRSSLSVAVAAARAFVTDMPPVRNV